MRVLDERTLIVMIREEWDKKLASLLEAGDSVVKATDLDALLTPGLKVKQVKTGLLFTVVSASPVNVTIKSPDGETSLVDAAKFQQGFRVD